MASLGVWKVSNPFTSSLKKQDIQNGSFLEMASASKDGLAISESGRSLKVQTEGPHLVSLGGGRLSTAITIHPLPEGRVFVGNPDANSLKDIVLAGPGIETDHCFIDNNNGLVTIYPQAGDVSIDGVHITKPTCLSQGCMLCLGRSNYFRFNNPKEALLMKQASPAPHNFQASSNFVPVSSFITHNGNQSQGNNYIDGLDLVQKISKFEYMSHSQPPLITSQDTPKYFVNEGIRFLQSAPPVLRVHKGYSSSDAINSSSSFARHYTPPIPAKPGFFTPPPYPQKMIPKVSMSPKTRRIYSKTPDPVMTSRTSPLVWSGRCTPTSPGCGSHHVSVENLKACEIELHEQHRKAVRERLEDQEQEKQERLRLEEILHLCAEYEEQAQKQRDVRLKTIPNPQDPASSSSGEFSSVSTDNSAPASTKSNGRSSKSESNGYSSEDAKFHDAAKYTTLPVMRSLQNQSLPVIQNSQLTSSSGYHTVPNRIKTNGSLPRDRNNVQLSPTSEGQNYGSADISCATTFTNHKALNSASSEDELCAILGNTSVSKLCPSHNCGPASPCMGTTTLLAYPHSPRTRIKTVVGQGSTEKVPEVYENKHVLSELATRKSNLTLTLPSTEASSVQPKPEFFDSKYANANYPSGNQIGADIAEEIDRLQKLKQECLGAITGIKHKVSELDCQKNEALNELELEHALLSSEVKDKDQLQVFEGNKLSEAQSKKLAIEKKSKVTQQELENAKLKIHQLETIVDNLQIQLCEMQHKALNELELNTKLDELKAQSELLDIERKMFEDMEFQQLEFQAHEEEEKDELNQEIECFADTIAQRQAELSELNKQKQTITAQIENEKLKCDAQLKVYTEELRKDIANLDTINSKLKALTSVKQRDSPCSSPESSPRTSESDVEVYRNGVWNVSSHLTVDDNTSMRRQSERSENCNSFHSFESESSSLTSSDTGGESGRRSEDKTKAGEKILDLNKVQQKERAIQLAYQDQTSLVNHLNQNGNFEVKLREKPRSQRPLTRYLPIRNSEFDLRQHIESAGHQIELCLHLHLTSTSCHGYLHKLGGTWKTWRKRWFVFDRIQKALLYYSDKGETKLKGGVNFMAIEEVYVDHLHSVKSPYPQSTFCVKSYDKVLYLMAPTPESMRIWVDVIFTGAEGYQDFAGEIE